MFFEQESHPWTIAFIDKFDDIIKELDQIIDQPLAPLHQTTWAGERPNLLDTEFKPEEAWKTFTFRFFGIDHLPNCDSCPTIAKLIEDQPSLITVEFSMLEPNTHILPHRGFTDLVLRSHLALKIPNGDVGIIVNDVQEKWTLGEFLIFNDSYRHEAWNKTNERRVVLMIDFVPEGSKLGAKEICKKILLENTDSHILNIAPRESWMEWLADGQFPTEV